jgi:hypothetical protein
MSNSAVIKHVLPAEFKKAFQYTVLDGKAQNRKVLDQELWGTRGVVYARVHRGKILHAGKADGSLRGRMGRHLKGVDTPDSNSVSS